MQSKAANDMKWHQMCSRKINRQNIKEKNTACEKIVTDKMLV